MSSCSKARLSLRMLVQMADLRSLVQVCNRLRNTQECILVRGLASLAFKIALLGNRNRMLAVSVYKLTQPPVFETTAHMRTHTHTHTTIKFSPNTVSSSHTSNKRSENVLTYEMGPCCHSVCGTCTRAVLTITHGLYDGDGKETAYWLLRRSNCHITIHFARWLTSY